MPSFINFFRLYLQHHFFLYFIDEEDPIEMIDLMLDDTSSEIGELHSIFLPFRIEEYDLHPVPSLDFTTFSGHRETSFLISASLFTVLYYLRIDHGDRTEGVIFIGLHE